MSSSLFQATTMGPLNPRQSPAPCSQTWWTRFCLMRNLTRRSSENAQPLSARWTEKTAPHQRRKRKKRGLRWSTAWLVSHHCLFLLMLLQFLQLVGMQLHTAFLQIKPQQFCVGSICCCFLSSSSLYISQNAKQQDFFFFHPYRSFLQTILRISCSACKVSTKSQPCKVKK